MGAKSVGMHRNGSLININPSATAQIAYKNVRFLGLRGPYFKRERISSKNIACWKKNREEKTFCSERNKKKSLLAAVPFYWQLNLGGNLGLQFSQWAFLTLPKKNSIGCWEFQKKSRRTFKHIREGWGKIPISKVFHLSICLHYLFIQKKYLHILN